jgi:hypothetical protein
MRKIHRKSDHGAYLEQGGMGGGIPGERGWGVYRATGDGEHTWRKRMGAYLGIGDGEHILINGMESLPRARGWGALEENEDTDLIWRKRGTCPEKGYEEHN